MDMTAYFLGRHAAGNSSSGTDLNIIEAVDLSTTHLSKDIYNAPALDAAFKEINETLDEKQEDLVSGKNIKTINNQSILGSGNISIDTVVDDSQGISLLAQILKQGVYNSDVSAEIQQLEGSDVIVRGTADSSSKTFEHIATVTVTPDEDGNLPNIISITKDDNGNAFELTDIYCDVLIGLTKGNSGRFRIATNNLHLFGNAALGFTNTALRKWNFRVDSFGENNGGLMTAPGSSIANTAGFPTPNCFDVYGQPIPIGNTINITKLEFIQLVGETFMEGTTITLWGVRKQ